MDYAATYLTSAGAAGTPQGAVWETAYDFRQESHFPSYSPASLQTIALLIRSNDVIRKKFLDFYVSHASSGSRVPAKDWLSYSCAQTEVTPEAFGKCACPPAFSQQLSKPSPPRQRSNPLVTH